MIEIPLSGKFSGMVALIDDEDAHLVIGRSWRGHKRKGRNTIYARSGFKGITLLHHVILGIKNPDFRRPVEHLDQNGLNCQKANLMVSTQSRNFLNRMGKAQANNLYSNKAGVRFNKHYGKWRAIIGACNREYGLGTYDTEAEAAATVARVREQLLAMPIEQWESFMSKYKHRWPEKPSRDTLHQKYIVEHMSLSQISNQMGHTKATIHRWLREYGISLRAPGKHAYQATY